MIDASSLLKNVKGFSSKAFETYNYEKALLESGFHQKNGNWFDSKGVFIGHTSGDAIDNSGIDFETNMPVDFFLVTKEECKKIVAAGEIVREFHGCLVWATVKGGKSKSDIFGD